MHVLALYAGANTPGHGNDSSGAFKPEAVFFERYLKAQGHTVTRLPFDNLLDKSKRGSAFLKLIDTAQPFHAFAYFGHGLRNSLPSAGIGPKERKALAKALASKALDKSRLVVALYACSTGETTTKQAEGEGGFADRLRDDLLDLGITGGWVDGHTNAAHTTMNPNLRRFLIDPAEKDGGGAWLVAPGSPAWPVWRARLKANWRTDPFRFQFPFLTADDVRKALTA